MVEAVGCENVHLRCNATDLDFAAELKGRGACENGRLNMEMAEDQRHVVSDEPMLKYVAPKTK